MSIKTPGERFCYLCDAMTPAQCICIKKPPANLGQPIKIVGISEPINETHAQIKTAVAKRNEEEYKRIWNSAIEAAAHQVMINVFHEAQDSEWDLGFNKCKEVAFNKIRELKK